MVSKGPGCPLRCHQADEVESGVVTLGLHVHRWRLITVQIEYPLRLDCLRCQGLCTPCLHRHNQRHNDCIRTKNAHNSQSIPRKVNETITSYNSGNPIAATIVRLSPRISME